MGELRDKGWETETIKVDCPHCKEEINVEVTVEAEAYTEYRLDTVSVD